jgi:hypothetical protein
MNYYKEIFMFLEKNSHHEIYGIYKNKFKSFYKYFKSKTLSIKWSP